ncbi:glycosyltransferase family 1 protein [Fictibacillus halophilus]|uniref:glycosyltransferase family 1 protein n=1 Tax=Fictibacillus halophilus TaxID=1610490 RepID=UPI0036447018
MKPERILQVVTIMNRGGLETMLMNYYRKLDPNLIQFDFMVHRIEEGHYDKEITKLGGRIYRMPQIRPGNYRRYFGLLEQFFMEHPEYKVVHSHINENSSFVLRAAKKAGVPCRIAHSHLSDLGLDMKLPFRLYARSTMKDNPSHYFACSTNAGEWLFGKQKATQVKVLNNAVNAEEFSFNQDNRERFRQELGMRDDQLVIGHIGRFNKQKNHSFLIDIFHNIKGKCPDAMLVLVGDGNLRLSMEKKVKELGLASNVRFLGVRSDISTVMHGIDLFLFPSLFEGLPVVLIEAQAAGLSCIVSDSITKESDITGRVKFINLKESAEAWADQILSQSYQHADTKALLRESGYDTATMAKWLSDYYMENYKTGVR